MKTYTCYSIKLFQKIVADGSTPIEVVQHKKTKRNGFVFLLTKKVQASLNEYANKEDA